jgi:hypothetical protein
MRNPTSKLASLLLYSSSNYATYSAAKVLLCMRRSSTSRVLLTRKALWPDGIMWRVFLLEPNPIYNLQSVHALSTARAEVHDGFEAPTSISAFESYHYISRYVSTYRRHNHLTLESSSDSVVDTLRLSPACVHTFVPSRLST